MNLENKIILNQYVKTTEFLGRVLGPDYEIVLYDLEPEMGSVIAIANSHISGKEPGSSLSAAEIQLLTDKSYLAADYRLHNHGMTQNNKPLRNSAMFIKNSAGELIGLLCMNFDDSRYRELSDNLLGLCHPDAFIETNFKFDESAVHRPAPPDPLTSINFMAAEAFQGSTEDTAREAAQNAIRELGFSGIRLTPDEKITVVERLDENGIFLLKGAVKEIADILQCSQATMYRYLSKIHNGQK